LTKSTKICCLSCWWASLVLFCLSFYIHGLMGRKRELGAFQNTHLQLYNIYSQKWLHFDNHELHFVRNNKQNCLVHKAKFTLNLNYNRVQSRVTLWHIYIYGIYIQHIIVQPFQQGYCKRVYAKLTNTFIYDITHKFYGIIL
jgi:hypothetical protein